VTLRSRLAIAAAATVTVAVAVSSLTVYLLMRSDLRRQVDTALQSRAAELQNRPDLLRRFDPRFFTGLPPVGFGGGVDYVQLVSANGAVVRPANEPVAVPVGQRALQVAAGAEDAYLVDTDVGGVHARVLTVPVGPGVALQLVRPLNEVDRELRRLGLILALVSVATVAAAGAAGAFVSRAVVAPVQRLTEAAERVARTRDPSERVPAEGADELSRLGGAFNVMLGELGDAIETQRRFVADASHELRTPLTSLQTNIEVLRRSADRLDPEQRRRLVADLERETHEMRGLVAGLLELARGRDGQQEPEPVHLDDVVASSVERARTRFPDVAFELDAEPTTVLGARERLDGAVSNLLENAAKWSPPGSAVEISLRDGELVVRDHGPGIADADKPHVFERFYRGEIARGMPGSGLGLAIVGNVVVDHGGRVAVEDAPGGGAQLRVALPTVATAA
jgi:two-component system sensor histidine kinase MprB